MGLSLSAQQISVSSSLFQGNSSDGLTDFHLVMRSNQHFKERSTQLANTTLSRRGSTLHASAQSFCVAARPNTVRGAQPLMSPPPEMSRPRTHIHVKALPHPSEWIGNT